MMDYVMTKDKEIIINIKDISPKEAYEIRVECSKYIKQGVNKFIFNMSKLTSINACLIGVILFVNKNSNGNTVLKNVSLGVLDILQKCRMDRVLKIER